MERVKRNGPWGRGWGEGGGGGGGIVRGTKHRPSI